MSPGLREVRPFRMWRTREIAGATPCRAISFSSARTVAVTWREHETRAWVHDGPRASVSLQGCGAPEPTGAESYRDSGKHEPPRWTSHRNPLPGSLAETPSGTNPQGVAQTETHRGLIPGQLAGWNSNRKPRGPIAGLGLAPNPGAWLIPYPDGAGTIGGAASWGSSVIGGHCYRGAPS
jgi:hypothetical protein